MKDKKVNIYYRSISFMSFFNTGSNVSPALLTLVFSSPVKKFVYRHFKLHFPPFKKLEIGKLK